MARKTKKLKKVNGVMSSLPGLNLIIIGFVIFVITMFDFNITTCAWYDILCKSGALLTSGFLYTMFQVLRLIAFLMILIGMYRLIRGTK